MKKYFVMAIVALSMISVSCSSKKDDDDSEDEELTVEEEAEEYFMDLLEDLEDGDPYLPESFSNELEYFIKDLDRKDKRKVRKLFEELKEKYQDRIFHAWDKIMEDSLLKAEAAAVAVAAEARAAYTDALSVQEAAECYYDEIDAWEVAEEAADDAPAEAAE